MFGALIGDCIGSFWEFSGNKDPQMPLWVPASKFTDDSVCTAAVLDWLLDDIDLTVALRARCTTHLERGFGGRMRRWVMDDQAGPYQSWGNGSAMRVSPVALWAQSESDLLDLARESAMPTHDSENGIEAAQATALAIRWALTGKPGNEILADIEARFDYPGLTDLDPEQVRPSHIYDVSAKGTVPLALAIATNARDFNEAMRLCCSMGGDADTLAAIAGPIAEALYGIPKEHIENAQLRFAGTNIWDQMTRLYAHPAVKSRLAGWDMEGGHILPESSGVRVPPLRLKFKPNAI